MASNLHFADARYLHLPVGMGVESGDPVVVGVLPGVALTDRTTGGTATIDTAGAYLLEVEGVDGGGNSAVAAGDVIYYDSGDLSKNNSGVPFGIALGTVGSGATATIPVRIGAPTNITIEEAT